MRFSLYLGAAALALGAPAAAAWQQATSKHFIIYGDMPAEEMKEYAEKLEKFDAAARLIRSMPDPVIGNGNRVQVFVVSSMLDVNRLLGQPGSSVLGYYVGEVAGPYIVTPRKIRRMRDLSTQDPDTTFFHEYTHHLQLQSTNKPMPAWLSEGFAEFLSDPIFGDDGSVGLGTPVKDRAEQLFQYRWAPLADLLAGDAFRLAQAGFWHQNYAQGWLLNHYLAFEPSRKGQIDAYVKRIGAGENPLAAAKVTFGDLGKLENELLEYRRVKNLPYAKVETSKLTVAPVTVTALSEGGSEVMPLRIYAKTGYESVSKGSVLEKVRDIAKRHPNDPLVLRTLAQIENDSENFDQAEAAADAALKLEPKSTEALIYKGRAYLGRGKKSQAAEQFIEARRWFSAANKIDPEDPEPLYLFYRTYTDANMPAPANALEAAKYAVILAPRDFDIAEELTVEFLRQNKMKEAAETIKPIAYLPHYGRGGQNDALKVLDLIDAGKRSEAIMLAERELLKDEDD